MINMKEVIKKIAGIASAILGGTIVVGIILYWLSHIHWTLAAILCGIILIGVGAETLNE